MFGVLSVLTSCCKFPVAYMCKNYESWLAVDKISAIIKKVPIYGSQCSNHTCYIYKYLQMNRVHSLCLYVFFSFLLSSFHYIFSFLRYYSQFHYIIMVVCHKNMAVLYFTYLFCGVSGQRHPGA